jgi:Family of unknown function (DUF5996)
MKIDQNGRPAEHSREHLGSPIEATHLPSLPLADWAATKDTLHLWFQIVGKIRLSYAPPKNHWWHVTLRPDVRGLTTGRIPVDETMTFKISFDLTEHFVKVRTSTGGEERLDLRDGLSVSAFDRELHAMLERLGIEVKIIETPYGVPMKTAFPEDEEHASYDRDAVTRYWRILSWSGNVFETFRGWFSGKASPVQVFWHTLDLAFARYSGRRAPARSDADPVTQEAYSHEVIAFGFWAGDQYVPEPSYYSYTAPEPPGLRLRELAAPARWSEQNGGSLALLAYDAVRSAPDPRATLLGFLQSSYEAGATAAGWDTAALASSWSPTPEKR